MLRNEIKELIVERANKYGPNNPQQIKQLSLSLAKADPEEVFYGLDEVFKSIPGQDYMSQELAGKILFKVRPRLYLDLVPLITGILENWNVSVEQLPFYFRDLCGIEVVAKAIENIDTAELNEIQKNSLETMKWWLRLTKNG
jgi:hypothetical protein